MQLDAVEVAYAEARKKFLPPFDMDAKEPHSVYSARDIAGEDCWDQISRVTDACLHQDDFVAALTRKGVWHNSVKELLLGFPTDATQVKHQIKVAILLNHAITFHVRKSSSLRGQAEYIARDLNQPVEVTRRLLELFTTTVSGGERAAKYVTSKQNRDKLCVHVLVLYLIAHGRTMKVGSIKPIVSDMKMEMSEAANLLREAGCTIQRAKDTMSAALRVPLAFPAPKKGARNQSGRQ